MKKKQRRAQVIQMDQMVCASEITHSTKFNIQRNKNKMNEMHRIVNGFSRELKCTKAHLIQNELNIYNDKKSKRDNVK